MGYHLRVKICGVTRPADAELAARLGADAIGLNFYSRSLRCVGAAAVPAILGALPPYVEPVALFVNERLQTMAARVREFGPIRTLQWHGDEPEMADASPFRFIPAFHVRELEQLAAVSRYLDACAGLGYRPAAVLLDAQVPGQYGGTGVTAPWRLLAEFRCPVPVILAGGLTPENVAEAVRVVRPYAVDVASGVEYQPGEKDPEKMRRFIENAREAGAKLSG